MNRKRITAMLVAGSVAVVVVLHYLGFLTGPEIGLRNVIDQTSHLLYRWAIPNVQNSQNNSNTDPAINQVGDQCAPESATIKELQDENDSLRDQIGFLKLVPQHVGADVIGRNIDPIGTTVVINRGSRDGIAVGNPVIVSRGFIIGKVARVDPTSAVVRLLSDNESKIAATIMNREKSIGLVEGGFGITVRLNFIPQNEIVRPGDVVVTSGLEPNIPRGLSLGTVEIVEKNPQEPFQQAILKPLADLHSLTVVSVLITTSTNK